MARKDLSIVGKLPKIEVLELSDNAFPGEEWVVADDGFPRLKFLLLSYIGIQYWRANGYHFPRLERLFLDSCCDLDSIPQEFGDIPTLQLIDLRFCSESVENSAKQIQQDVHDNYGGSIVILCKTFSSLIYFL